MNIPSIEQLASDLISIPSVTEDRAQGKEAIDLCEKILDGLPNVTIARYECGGHHSMVATYNETKNPDVLLSAHLDVVDSPPEGFQPYVKDGKLYGRGAYDMKGNAAACITAFMKHVKSGAPLSLGLMLTTDEEEGGFSGVRYLLHTQEYRAKCVILPDGGGPDFSLVTTQLGVLWMRISQKGKSVHSSTPEKGKNAITTLMNRYFDLEKSVKQIPDTTMTLSGISGAGKAFNMVPDLCEMNLDIRSPDTQKVVAIIREHFSEEEIELRAVEPAFHIDQAHPYVSLYKEVATEIIGTDMPFKIEKGASDARFFTDFQIPVLIPSGRGGGHHQDVEHIELLSLEVLEKSITSFMQKVESRLLAVQISRG